MVSDVRVSYQKVTSTMLRSVGARVTRKSFLSTAALTSYEEDVASVALGPFSQQSTVTTSELPNGIKVTSLGPAASCVIGVCVQGLGTADGLPGASETLKQMAFKSAHGKSDLAIQRKMELDGITGHGSCQEHSLFLAAEGLPEYASEMASVLADAVHRDPMIPWEVAETVKEPELTLDSTLKSAVLSAAYGFDRRFQLNESTELDEFLGKAVASAPISIVGVGLDHPKLLEVATPTFAGLPKRVPVDFPPASFVPGFASKSFKFGSSVAIAYPCEDPVVAEIFAGALGGFVAQGLLVLSGKAKEALVKDAASLTSIDLQISKTKVQLLSKNGVELAQQVATTGLDPAALVKKIEALSPADLKKAAKAMLAKDPAVAIVTPDAD